MGVTELRDRDQSSWTGYMALMMVLLVAEGVVLHLWLGSISIWFSVAVAVTHVAILWFLIADARRIRAAPGWTVDEREVRVDLGWRGRGVIERANIVSIEPADERTRAELRAHVAGFPEQLITVREPVELVVYGRTRRGRTIAIAVDGGLRLD